MPRCLELLAKRNMVPAYWHAECAGSALDIEFQVTGVDEHLEAYMAECLRQIVNVETVFTSGMERPQRRAACA